MVEYFPLIVIEKIFRFSYHWRAIDTALVRSIALNRSQQNHSHLIVSFYNHLHMHYFVHISSIKSGREVVKGLKLCRINRKFWFYYHWRAIYTALLLLIALNRSHQNHSYLTIPFSNHLHMYYFVHNFSIKAGREVVEYFSLCRIERSFHFCYHWRAIDTDLIRLIALNTSKKNHSHLITSFPNHNHLYYFVQISSIRTGREVVEDVYYAELSKDFYFSIIG